MTKDLIPKAYTDGPNGQTHYRHFGRLSELAVVLIHWTPASGRMYAPIIPALAEAGFRVLAPDLLGYGRSDPRPDPWRVADWAAELIAVIDNLGISDFFVLGGHMGAAVATETAITAGARAKGVILDGCPLLTPELKAVFKAMADSPRPTPSEDSGHEKLAFERVLGTYKEYIPGFEVTPESLERLWPAIIDYLETDFVSSGPVAAEHDLENRLPLLRQPVLLLKAQTDTLAGTFDRAKALLGKPATHTFTGHHPLHFPERAQEYLKAVLSFLQKA